MKLFTTLIQRIAALAVVLVMAFGVNATERTFATIAEMNAATDLAEGDVVTITNDVVVEYLVKAYMVIKDKEGTATCVNHSYAYFNIESMNAARTPEICEEYDIPTKLVPGDYFQGYKATVKQVTPYISLEPALDKEWLMFKDFTEVKGNNPNYKPITTKVTVRQLLDSPADYVGKVVSLDYASTYTVGFNNYLIQGTDTLEKFTIYGLDTYPNNLTINQALCTDQSGSAKLHLTSSDYEPGRFTTIQGVKSSKMTENIPLNITAQVLRKEVYEGKTYITIITGEGSRLLDYSGIRVLLNTENDVDKTLKMGDIINLKADAAQLSIYSKNLSSSKHSLSLLTIDVHETTIIENKPVQYLSVSPEEITSLEYFEYLPVTLDGFVNLSGEPTSEQVTNNVAPATLTSQFGDIFELVLDLTYMPKEGTDFIVAGILDVPLWQKSAKIPTIVPLSDKDFMSSSYTFDNIEEMVDFGAPSISIISYKLNSALTVTGVKTIEAVGDEDRDQHVVFVTDGTASLMLKDSAEYVVGEAITSVWGFYSNGRSSIKNDGFIDFGVAPSFEINSLEVEEATPVEIDVVQVTIGHLLASDKYASSLVCLSDFTYKTVEETVQDTIVTRHFIYQGSDSIAVDESFAAIEDKSILNAIYYLNGFYTRLIPYEGEITGEVIVPTSVESILNDNTIYMADNIVYAQGAEIEVYDIMGRMIVAGVDAVALEYVGKSVFIVCTKYADGQMFVTKIANR